MCSRVPKIATNAPVNQHRMSSSYYLKKAEQSCNDNNYPEAYKNFVNYFEAISDPCQAPPAIQLGFTKLVCKIGIVLEETNDTDELIKIYLQVLNFFPNNYIILNNLGAHLFKIGQTDIARRYLDLAVNCSRSYLPAEKNLLHCKWQQVPRWHFRMLNDRRRNLAYYNAIFKAVNGGFNMVVDIGSGCGLLSLFASKNPDSKVTAIEENKVMVKMCEKILKENNIKNVNVINCYSTKLTESPAPCNLLVTEIFDIAIFGERMLESMVHAHTLLITEKKFKIIPASAKLYATGINCDELNRKHRYVNSIPELNLENICIRQMDPEPYDGEHLAERRAHYVTKTVEVFDIDFYNLEQLTKLLNDKEFAKDVSFEVTESGWLHAIAVWFDLRLDEQILITTNPLDKNRVMCWEQAVFYLDHPMYVQKEQKLNFQVTVVDSQLKFKYVDEIKDPCCECWLVSKDVISFLNDEKLVRSLIDLSKKFAATDITIMDLHVIPLLGYMLAKQGCKVYTALKEESSLKYMNFFEHILRINNIPAGKMVVLEERISYNPVMCVFHEYLAESHLCIIDPVSVDGSLQQIMLFKEKTGPKFDALIMPKTIKIKILLICSVYLFTCNVVRDDNVLNFKVGKFINEYTGNEHPNLEKFPYATYSSPVTFVIDDDYVKKSQNILVTKSGTVNALYSWFEITYYEDITFSTFDSTHFKKSCYLIRPRTVELGDLYRVNMRREEAYLDFNIK